MREIGSRETVYREKRNRGEGTGREAKEGRRSETENQDKGENDDVRNFNVNNFRLRFYFLITESREPLAFAADDDSRA